MKKKVIIDMDPGIDDSLALMLAGLSNELDILGITTVAGNVEVAQTSQNAVNILNLINRNDIPVYQGSDTPLKKEPIFAKETHGDKGLGNTNLDISPNNINDDALTFMSKILEENEDVSIIALGPLTNIAKLIEKYPDKVEKINEVVLMGGNYKSHGNCSPVAEFNFWFDPDSAKIVFDQLNRPITMVGLDVTREIILSPNYLKLIELLNTNLSKPIVDMLDFYNDFHWKYEGILGSVINDPLAIAYFLDNSLCEGINAHVDIITEGPAIGMSMVDEYGITGEKFNCKVLTSVNKEKFFKRFLYTLFPDYKKEIKKVLDTNE